MLFKGEDKMFQDMIIDSLTGRKLNEMFSLLYNHFGPQGWWPGETTLEVMVGTVLTQNTNWKNAAKAIENLKNRDLLSINALYSLKESDLAQEIQSAGYFNIKAKRLKNLINYIAELYRGELSLLFEEDTQNLRESLLSIKGIGPETADSILLYAGNRPVFVIDAYTYRILLRHSMCDEQIAYHELQEIFMDNLPEDAQLFNEFHALIVQTGKEFCSKKPACDACPLKEWETVSV